MNDPPPPTSSGELRTAAELKIDSPAKPPPRSGPFARTPIAALDAATRELNRTLLESAEPNERSSKGVPTAAVPTPVADPTLNHLRVRLEETNDEITLLRLQRAEMAAEITRLRNDADRHRKEIAAVRHSHASERTLAAKVVECWSADRERLRIIRAVQDARSESNAIRERTQAAAVGSLVHQLEDEKQVRHRRDQDLADATATNRGLRRERDVLASRCVRLSDELRSVRHEWVSTDASRREAIGAEKAAVDRVADSRAGFEAAIDRERGRREEAERQRRVMVQRAAVESRRRRQQRCMDERRRAAGERSRDAEAAGRFDRIVDRRRLSDAHAAAGRRWTLHWRTVAKNHEQNVTRLTVQVGDLQQALQSVVRDLGRSRKVADRNRHRFETLLTFAKDQRSHRDALILSGRRKEEDIERLRHQNIALRSAAVRCDADRIYLEYRNRQLRGLAAGLWHRRVRSEATLSEYRDAAAGAEERNLEDQREIARLRQHARTIRTTLRERCRRTSERLVDIESELERRRRQLARRQQRVRALQGVIDLTVPVTTSELTLVPSTVPPIDWVDEAGGLETFVDSLVAEAEKSARHVGYLNELIVRGRRNARHMRRQYETEIERLRGMPRLRASA